MQETIVVTVPMEKPAFVATVHRIIGRIEIEDQRIWCFIVRDDKLRVQYLLQANGNRPINPILQSTQRLLTAQHVIPFHGSLDRGIAP